MAGLNVHTAILYLSIIWLAIGLVITFWRPRAVGFWAIVKMMLVLVWVFVGALDLISFYRLWTFRC